MKMTKTWLAVCLAPLLLASCLSVPRKLAEGDCLVIMKVVSINESRFDDVRTYAFELADGSGSVVFRPTDRIITFYLSAPTSISKLTSWISAGVHNLIGDRFSQDMRFRLPYRPNGIFVLSTGFLVETRRDPKQDRTGMEMFFSKYSFFKLDGTEREDLAKELRKSDNFKTWEDSDEADWIEG